MTDRDLARIQAGVYERNDESHIGWDDFERGDGDSGICWGCKVVGGVSVIALRGSVTFVDWIRDLWAFAPPFQHGVLGPVHPGFFCGMAVAWDQIRKRTKGPRVVIGHSLGAARAAVLCGLMVLDHEIPLARVVWGEPKPGFRKLADLIRSIPGRSYRNGDGGRHHDLVTDVPLSFPPEEYVRCGKLIDVQQVPTDWSWGMFSWHSMSLYCQGTPETAV